MMTFRSTLAALAAGSLLPLSLCAQEPESPQPKATEQAWLSLARVLFSSNEFMFLD